MPKKVKDKTFSMRLDTKTFDALNTIATRNDRSVGYIVRQAIERYIKENS